MHFLLQTVANQPHHSNRRVCSHNVLGLVRVALDPVGVRGHELLQKFARALIRERAFIVKPFGNVADIRLRHLHARHVEKNE